VGVRFYAKRIRLYGFSCVHFGDRDGHDADLWTRCLQDIDGHDQAVVFGLGDYLDFTRTTYRGPLKAINSEDDKFYDELDSMVMDSHVYRFVDTVRKHCPSFAKKCVGLVEGNHYHRFHSGITSTQEICRLLGVRYLGLSALVRLTMYRGRGTTKFGKGMNLVVLLNHSISSSQSLPASLASASRKLPGWRGVDVFLSGNDHQLGSDVEQQIGVSHSGAVKMMQHEMVIGKCGSFQRAYTPGADPTHYVEKKLLKPSRLGWLAFDAWPHQGSAHGQKTGLETWRFENFTA